MPDQIPSGQVGYGTGLLGLFYLVLDPPSQIYKLKYKHYIFICKTALDGLITITINLALRGKIRDNMYVYVYDITNMSQN